MDEEFEKYAAEKADEWAASLCAFLEENRKYLDVKSLAYLILKAMRTGYGYGKSGS